MMKKRMKHLGWALLTFIIAWIFFLSYIHSPSLPAILLTISMLGFTILNLRMGFWTKAKAKGGKKPPPKAAPAKGPPPQK